MLLMGWINGPAIGINLRSYRSDGMAEERSSIRMHQVLQPDG